jgi:hypothetical protein
MVIEYASKREFRNLPECIQNAVKDQIKRKQLLKMIEDSYKKDSLKK